MRFPSHFHLVSINSQFNPPPTPHRALIPPVHPIHPHSAFLSFLFLIFLISPLVPARAGSIKSTRRSSYLLAITAERSKSCDEGLNAFRDDGRPSWVTATSRVFSAWEPGLNPFCFVCFFEQKAVEKSEEFFHGRGEFRWPESEISADCMDFICCF